MVVWLSDASKRRAVRAPVQEQNAVTHLIGPARRVARWLSARSGSAPMVCDCPWSTLFVWATGEVSYCGRTAAKGDLLRIGLGDFWNSPEVSESRYLFAHDRHLQSGCMPTCNVLTAKRSDEFVGNYLEDHRANGRPPLPVPSVDDLPRSRHPGAVTRPANATLARREAREGASIVRSLPRELHIQISDFCSLCCPMCCCGIIEPAQKAKVMRVLDARVLDELQPLYPFVERIEILGGEPFDQPFSHGPLRRILDDVALLPAPRPKIKIATNGNNLNARWVDDLLARGVVDVLSFSIDRVDPMVYAATRIGGSLDKALRNIDRLRERRDALGRSEPRIHWTSVLGLHTYPGIGAFVQASKQAGAVRIDFQPMNSMGHPSFYADNNLFDERHLAHLVELLRRLIAVDVNSNRDDIIAMTLAFIRRSGRYEALLGTEAELTRSLDVLGLLRPAPTVR